MDATAQHEHELDDEVDGREDADVDEVAALEHLPLARGSAGLAVDATLLAMKVSLLVSQGLLISETVCGNGADGSSPIGQRCSIRTGNFRAS